MTEVLTIGAFLHDLNIPGLKKQANALSCFQEAIDVIFTTEQQPNLNNFCQKYQRERFIKKTVAEGLDYYYKQFKIKIKNEYALKFLDIIEGNILTKSNLTVI